MTLLVRASVMSSNQTEASVIPLSLKNMSPYLFFGNRPDEVSIHSKMRLVFGNRLDEVTLHAKIRVIHTGPF